MLLVLFIVMNLLIFSTFHLRSLYERQTIDQFFQQLQEDIWLAQQVAISHSKTIEMSFHEQKNYYDIRESGLRELVLKRLTNQDIQVRPLTISNPIRFNASGNINSSGTMYVIYHQQTYKVTFLLGRGRFKVEKL
ncbi:competence type IV pilus minor pilin ComGD [Bacillus pinisoli]|uniref:competence type IV pilus minor pilin ComGD n=1 Tax=Bacillus pinisoli TaxID=2901866 RepID=UPI001FF1C20C|nr:competence type IV pilus minor pilin ComGD [Bacillus pinisoli]